MPDRLSSLAFWAIFAAIIFAVGYPTLEALRDDGQHQRDKPPAVAVPSAPPQLAVRAMPPAPAVHANVRRWFADTDFAFSGRWEHVRKLFDGRTNGTSSRSFHAGSQATLTFTGQSLRLYGVVGPRGGLGVVTIDGRVQQLVRFYAPAKSVHRLVYTSPPLRPGPHRLTISVLSDRTLQATRARYVNIDGADV